MDIISILQVCSAWSYNFLRFQSHFPQNSLCCRSPPSTWFPPFLILLFCLIPQFFTFPIFFLQVFLFLILLFAKTLLVSDLLFNRPLTVLASPIPFHCLIMRRKNWDEISKRHVSVWKWRNYIEIVRAFSDINIGLPSFAIRCKVESRKTGLPEDPMYLETSVSKTIVRNNLPCRCHDCQSESRINIFMLFTHLLETMTSKVLSGPLSISFQIPVQKSNSRWVPICKVWTEWLLEGSHSDRTWLDRSHLASNYYCLLVTLIWMSQRPFGLLGSSVVVFSKGVSHSVTHSDEVTFWAVLGLRRCINGSIALYYISLLILIWEI